MSKFCGNAQFRVFCPNSAETVSRPVGLSPVAVTQTPDFAPVSSKEFLDIQATLKCGFTLKPVRDMTTTYSQMHRTVQIITQKTAQSFDQFGQMVECSFKN